MATVKFYTRTNDLTKLAPVYMRLTDTGGVNLIVRTEFRMIPAYWNVKKQELRDSIVDVQEEGETDNKKITFDDVQKWADEFAQLKKFILKEYRDRKTDITAEWLTGVVDKFFKKDAPKVETLRQYIERFYDEAKAGTRLAAVGNTKRRYAYETLRSIKGTKLSFMMLYTEPRTMELLKKKGYTADDLKKQNEDALTAYKECKEQAEEEYNSGMLKVANFNDITIDWYNDFLQFFYARGCGANYLGRHIKTLKTILRAAREEGLHNNTEIERKTFKAISEPSESIYLTAKEVQAMYEKDLSDSPVLAKVRDVFLCGVYTAQRYSDYSRISKDMIKEEDGTKYIELIQQKTGEKCMIPMRPELETILSRYDFTLPKTFEQKINENIKTIGRDCGIKEGISTETFKSGMKVKTIVPKYKLIKTHTARRTGCTLMYLAGIPTIDIMKVSGHKTEKEFLKYIKVGKKETALNLAKHPYFIGSPLSVAK